MGIDGIIDFLDSYGVLLLILFVIIGGLVVVGLVVFNDSFGKYSLEEKGQSFCTQKGYEFSYVKTVNGDEKVYEIGCKDSTGLEYSFAVRDIKVIS